MDGAGRKGHIIRSRYEATAKGYDELYRAEQFEKYSLTLRKRPPSGRVLDAGCGTGLLAEYMRVAGYLENVSHYVCLDYSGEMLRIARWRFSKICPGKCTVVEGNVMTTPFTSKAFDITYSFTVLDLVDRLEEAISELTRVTRGPVVISLLKKLPYKDLLLKKLYKVIAISSKDVVFEVS